MQRSDVNRNENNDSSPFNSPTPSLEGGPISKANLEKLEKLEKEFRLSKDVDNYTKKLCQNFPYRYPIEIDDFILKHIVFLNQDLGKYVEASYLMFNYLFSFYKSSPPIKRRVTDIINKCGQPLFNFLNYLSRNNQAYFEIILFKMIRFRFPILNEIYFKNFLESQVTQKITALRQSQDLGKYLASIEEILESQYTNFFKMAAVQYAVIDIFNELQASNNQEEFYSFLIKTLRSQASSLLKLKEIQNKIIHAVKILSLSPQGLYELLKQILISHQISLFKSECFDAIAEIFNKLKNDQNHRDLYFELLIKFSSQTFHSHRSVKANIFLAQHVKELQGDPQVPLKVMKKLYGEISTWSKQALNSIAHLNLVMPAANTQSAQTSNPNHHSQPITAYQASDTTALQTLARGSLFSSPTSSLPEVHQEVRLLLKKTSYLCVRAKQDQPTITKLAFLQEARQILNYIINLLKKKNIPVPQSITTSYNENRNYIEELIEIEVNPFIKEADTCIRQANEYLNLAYLDKADLYLNKIFHFLNQNHLLITQTLFNKISDIWVRAANVCLISANESRSESIKIIRLTKAKQFISKILSKQEENGLLFSLEIQRKFLGIKERLNYMQENENIIATRNLSV